MAPSVLPHAHNGLPVAPRGALRARGAVCPRRPASRSEHLLTFPLSLAPPQDAAQRALRMALFRWDKHIIIHIDVVDAHGFFTQAESRWRPLARRRPSTRRPFRVARRARKPCRRLRTRLEGWYVRLTHRADPSDPSAAAGPGGAIAAPAPGCRSSAPTPRPRGISASRTAPAHPARAPPAAGGAGGGWGGPARPPGRASPLAAWPPRPARPPPP